MLKKGDKVVMHTCVESEDYPDKVWTCQENEEIQGEGSYTQNVIFLEGFSGRFKAKFLRKV